MQALPPSDADPVEVTEAVEAIAERRTEKLRRLASPCGCELKFDKKGLPFLTDVDGNLTDLPSFTKRVTDAYGHRIYTVLSFSAHGTLWPLTASVQKVDEQPNSGSSGIVTPFGLELDMAVGFTVLALKEPLEALVAWTGMPDSTMSRVRRVAEKATTQAGWKPQT